MFSHHMWLPQTDMHCIIGIVGTNYSENITAFVIWLQVLRQKFTDVPAEPAVSIFRPEDGGSKTY